jgi:hypothetical protein
MPKKTQCYHKLEHLNEPPYRYRCTVCGKKLKIASGHYPPKHESGVRVCKGYQPYCKKCGWEGTWNLVSREEAKVELAWHKVDEWACATRIKDQELAAKAFVADMQGGALD